MLPNNNQKTKKVIFLIGSTGKGKSTLANVLINKDNNFEEVFKESGKSVSGTRETQKEEFVEDNSGISYAIIDTVGMGDTKLSKEEVLDKIADAVYLAQEGIGQILFVISEKFDQQEMSNYDLLRETIFDDEVVKHTTIVRTRFTNFKESKKCEKDINSMIEQGGKLTEIIKSCWDEKNKKYRVIHVENPSLDLVPAKDAVREQKRKEKIANRKETRKASREILVSHLQKICLDQEKDYKPKNLEELNKEIIDYMRSKMELKEKLKRLENREVKIVSENNQEKVSAESKKKEPITKKEEKQTGKSLISNVEDIKIEEEIKKLESRKERIKKEIKQKEKIIRQKVLKHILNNYDNINEVPGGDIFVDSIVGDSNNWEEINKEFSSKKLVGEWINCEFNYQQVQKWANALGSNFVPSEVYFYAWLKNSRQLTPQEVLDISIEKLKTKYFEQLNQEVNILDSHNQQLSQLEDINIAQHFRENFPNWTSGNSEIDRFIQQHQLKATNYAQILEWIPYDEFANVEHLADGGFGKVYKAKWVDGPIEKWNPEKNSWERCPEVIILKSLSNSQNITAEFLQEVAYNKLLDSDSNIIKIYGISREPLTYNYVMVTQYMEDGNLKEYLQNNYSKLSFEDKLFRSQNIAFGLHSIHKKNLIHRDLHPGNILNDSNYSYISDLGLSKLVNEEDNGKVFGIIPYMAPEVLIGQPYTQAADIYSWSLITYEILSWLSPYYGRYSDTSLALEICRGLRPRFHVKIPQLLEDLINRCWDAKPSKRPAASELSNILGKWYNELEDENSEIYRQVQEAEEYNKTLPDEIKYPNYQFHEIWHSKSINTKQINELLPITEDFDSLLLTKEINLDELNIQEEQQQSQIQIPPK